MLSQRFFPSEFGNDVDRVHAVEPARTSFATKAKIRRAVEAEGIPYTYVASNFFAGLYLSSFSQPGAAAPPRDKVVIGKDCLYRELNFQNCSYEGLNRLSY
ncbi:hypothetical protein WN944_029086 [Citrus x changshan-huyou]|uniref:NmrA-like domain-containing protein n=1 Tax=Citrus x changshan-huyou TaxID=2935761 RepID=A0AAP0LKJ2_9ROSI